MPSGDPIQIPNENPSPGPAPQLSPGGGPQAPIGAFGGGESLEKTFQSTGNLAQTSIGLLEKQKQNMDEMVLGQADVDLAKAKSAAMAQAMQKFRGASAEDALPYAKDVYEKAVTSIQKGMQNPDQQRHFTNLVNQHAADIVTTLTNFRTQQFLEWDKTTTEDRIKNYADEGIMSGGNPKTIQIMDAQIRYAWKDYGRRMGWDDETIKAQQRDSLSVMHGGVISNFLAQGQYPLAQQYFDNFKDKISPARLPGLQNELRNGAVQNKAVELWHNFPNYRLANGALNLDKLDRDILADPTFTDNEKLEIQDKVRMLGRSDNMARAEQKQNDTENFQNWVIKTRSSGTSLADAMSQLTKQYNPNKPEEYIQRLKMVKEAYGPAKESDPDTYLYFKRAIDSGDQLDPGQLDKAYADDKLNLKDYVAFGGSNMKNAKGSKSETDKYADQAISAMVKAHFGDDPKAAADFHRAVDSQNLTGQAKQDWAAKALGEDTNTNQFKDMSVDWKGDADKLRQENEEVTQLNKALGPSVVSAIGEGYRSFRGMGYKTKPQDIVLFVNAFGGPDKVKPGTPVYNAIQLAIQYHHPVTALLITQYLDKYEPGWNQ
jgi:hypothetical protein